MSDDLEGFALLERDSLRRTVPGFDWLRFEAPSPRHRLALDPADATIALVSTAGARLLDQPPFDAVSAAGDPTYRVIPSDTPPAGLAFEHGGYDVRHAYADHDSVFPLALLRRYVEEGRLGALGPSAYVTMGYVAVADPLVAETAPAIADALRRDAVDLALLVPV